MRSTHIAPVRVDQNLVRTRLVPTWTLVVVASVGSFVAGIVAATSILIGAL